MLLDNLLGLASQAERDAEAYEVAAREAVRGLVGFDRDRGFNPTPPQVSTVGCRRIRLIGKNAIRAGSGATDPEARDADPGEHGCELGAVRPLTGRDNERQRAPALVGGEMQFRGEPAPRTSEPMISGFVVETARRFDLPVRVAAGPAVVRSDAGAGAANAARLRVAGAHAGVAGRRSRGDLVSSGSAAH